MPAEGGSSSDVGVKRRAEDDADDSGRGDQEIPLSEASMDVGDSSGSGSKRSREEEDDERQATRMRLEKLVHDSHGGQPDEECLEIKALMSMVSPSPRKSEYPIAFDAGGALWSDICSDAVRQGDATGC